MTANTLAVRGRYISPAFWTSDDVCDLPSDSHRVMFIGLWAGADREGRLKDEPGRIGRRVRSWDPRGAAPLIDHLVSVGMVVRYVVGDQRCLWLPAFKKWQHVHPHEARSSLPPPPNGPMSRNVITSHDAGTAGETPVAADAPALDGSKCPSEPSEPSEPSGKSNAARSENATLFALELVASKPPDSSAIEDDIFEHWRAVMGKNGASQFTKERRDAVRERLAEGRSAADIKRAIEGCAKTPFNMGLDPKHRGQKRNDLELICRTGGHVERFMENADSPPPVARAGPDPNTGIIGADEAYRAEVCACCGDTAGGGHFGEPPRWLCYGRCLAAARDWAEEQAPGRMWTVDVGPWIQLQSTQSQGVAQ